MGIGPSLSPCCPTYFTKWDKWQCSHNLGRSYCVQWDLITLNFIPGEKYLDTTEYIYPSYWRLLETIGGYWELLETTGYYWRLLEITGDYWRLLEITGDYWRLPEITGDYWTLLDNYWGLLETTGDYWGLLEINENFWRLLEITGNYWRSGNYGRPLAITGHDWRFLDSTRDYWGLLDITRYHTVYLPVQVEVTGRLLIITGDYRKLLGLRDCSVLQITGDYWRLLMLLEIIGIIQYFHTSSTRNSVLSCTILFEQESGVTTYYKVFKSLDLIRS